MVDITSITNYHQKQKIAEIGFVVVHTGTYRARWEYGAPTVLSVRKIGGETDWCSFAIGGYCDDGSDSHEILPDTWRPGFINDVHLCGQNTDLRSLTFTAQSKCGGTYTYTINFYEDRISVALSYRFTGSMTLKKVLLNTLGSSAGTISGRCVFSPNPSSSGIYTFGLDRHLIIGSGGEKWLTPAPYCFPFEMENRQWTAVALAPEPDQLQFTSFEFLPNKTGMLFGLDYSSEPEYQGEYDAPELWLLPEQESPFAALRNYSDTLVSAGKLAPLKREPAPWWRGLMVCGWIEQDGVDHCTQQVYEGHVAQYEQAGIDFDILTIDDFWGKDPGIWQVDPVKWPDLRGFINGQHRKGRHVLLWVCILTDGLPDEELYITGEHKMLDPLNPQWQRRLRNALTHMLSNGEGCLDADGIKLDFTGGVPPAGIPRCTRRLYGQEYLYVLFQTIYRTLKDIKRDALADLQVANPYFASTYDMTRINDFFLPGYFGIECQKPRALIAGSAGFGALVDTDGVPDEDYFRQAHSFGNLSLYLTNEQIRRYQDVLRETASRIKAEGMS
jgi:hypothetical protein